MQNSKIINDCEIHLQISKKNLLNEYKHHLLFLINQKRVNQALISLSEKERDKKILFMYEENMYLLIFVDEMFLLAFFKNHPKKFEKYKQITPFPKNIESISRKLCQSFEARDSVLGSIERKINEEEYVNSKEDEYIDFRLIDEFEGQRDNKLIIGIDLPKDQHAIRFASCELSRTELSYIGELMRKNIIFSNEKTNLLVEDDSCCNFIALTYVKK